MTSKGRLWDRSIYCSPYSSVTLENFETCWQEPNHHGPHDWETRTQEYVPPVKPAAPVSPCGRWKWQGGFWVDSDLLDRESAADRQQRRIEREHARDGRFA